MPVPSARLRAYSQRPINRDGAFVLYWMTTARRVRSNFALQRAVDLANEFKRPLVILEALRCDYPWASDRLHTFVLEGMAANRKAVAGTRAGYYPYVETRTGEGHGLISALGSAAAAIVTDWYPTFFIPRMLDEAARQTACRLEAVDSNGLIPLAEHPRPFPTARGFRAFVQRSLATHLRDFPLDEPLSDLLPTSVKPLLPADIASRWPALEARSLRMPHRFVAQLPIDHTVRAVHASKGGSENAAAALRTFVADRLLRYDIDSNHPDLDGTSHLSPYLHFGHISAHDVFAAVMTAERWTTRRLGTNARGAREGWWGISPAAEAFLDQLVVWRELAFNGAHHTPDYGTYATVPAWARRTLEAHQCDERAHLYQLDEFDAAATHDRIWNAAMRQLKCDGWFHGYMRMLWGKKILEWSPTPEDALNVMEQLMNRYSLDGRDPVSYASYAWVLGLYDRPWPERPIYGVVRSMTSESAKRKLKLKQYLETYGGCAASES